MKYRVIKDGKVYKVQEKGFLTFWFWNTCYRYGGSFGDVDFEFNTIDEARAAITEWTAKRKIEVIK